MDKNRAIGKNNKLPWNLPKDLEYFKKTTLGYPVIMGYKTYCSLPKALPKRRNIVLHIEPIKLPGCEVVCSINEVFERLSNESEVFVIGGATVYKQFLPYASELYVTLIDEIFEADTFFPEIDFSDWQLVSSIQGIKDEKNIYDYFFNVYKRKS